MNCERVRDLLLTDYTDKRIGVRTEAQVQKHLSSCLGCRRFEEGLRASAISPFKNAQNPAPPESLWPIIKGKIVKNEAKQPSLLGILKERFIMPRPAFSLIVALAVILIVSTLVTKYNVDRNQIKEYFAQQMDFYSQLNGEEGASNHAWDLGTAVEGFIF